MDNLVERLRAFILVCSGTKEAYEKHKICAARVGEAAGEIERLHDLHLERTHLTTKALRQRDEARERIAAYERVLSEIAEIRDPEGKGGWVTYSSGLYKTSELASAALPEPERDENSQN